MNKKSLQIGVWLAAIALALGIAARFWSVTFPVAAVPFPLTRAEVTGRMEKFLASMGAPVGEYRGALRFGEAAEARNFIERQYGPASLATAAHDGVDLWYWTGRWFKAGQHEEYRASSDQEGNIVGYSHIIEEERALPSLTEAQARTVAENFLRAHISQHPFAALHYLETSTEQKPRRMDYNFVWEQDSLRMGEAPYQLSVAVHGNEVGGYAETLKVPEWWLVQYARQRSVNDFCYRLATFATSCIVAGLVITLLIGIRNHQVRWRDAVPWGWLALIGAVAAATQIDSIPDILFGYPTTQQWEPFVAGAVFDAVRSVLGQVLLFWALMLVADCIYRECLTGKSSFRRALGPAALRDSQTVRALGVGIAFAVFSFAYVCLFYAAGRQLGVWCPVEVDLSRAMSGPMPWVQAMQTGFSASFNEEMIFRAGAILLLWRILRVRWAAVVLSAAAWGFMHSNYPQIPGYTRGIELTIVGIVWGALMLRYGIVATLTAHYLYDCGIGSLAAFQAAGWENKAGAIAVTAWPLALFLWGTFRSQPELEPEQARVPGKPSAAQPPVREWAHVQLQLSPWGVALMLAACAAALALIVLLPKPQDKFSTLGRLDISRTAILEKADAALKDHGYAPDGYERVTETYVTGLPAEYLLEHGSLDRLAELYRSEFPDLYWLVRYFRFLQPEEFTVKLDAHGRFLTWDHTVLREGPGAELGESQALAQAGKALEEDGGIDLSRQEIVLKNPVEQEHRRDWFFGFDQKDFNWGDAKLRTYIRLQGAEAVNLSRFIKVPDVWLLEFNKKGWKQLISGELQRWMQWALEAILGLLFILAIEKHLTPWRQAFLYALFPLGIKFTEQANQMQQLYWNYQTTVSRAQYLAAQLGSRAEDLLWGYLAAVFVIGIALGLLRWAWGWTPDQVIARPARSSDTVLIALVSIVAFWLLGLVNAEALGHFWPAEAATIHFWSVDEWAPCLGAVTEALQHAYDEIIRLAIAASVLRLIWDRRPVLAWALLLLLPLLNITATETLGGLLWSLAYAEAVNVITAWLVLKVWRFNLPAIFLTYALSSLCESIALFLRKGGPEYQWQAAPLAALILAVVAAPIVLRNSKGARHLQTASSP